MSFSETLPDPLVRAFFKKKHGGSGGGVDDGYFIEWDGNTEGREEIMVMGSLPLYKVSNIVFDTAKLTGAKLWNHTDSGNPFEYDGGINVVGGDGWCVAMGESLIYVISGKAGNHNYSGIDVFIPSDGTYFLSYAYGSTRRIAKPSTV